MDIEQLSKSQIVLLTLLVSFVTSIATGIVTVSLMDQAPPAIAQTVNRIIERTVEKVVPQGQTAATVVTQEKTVVIKESALISEMVGRVESSVVRLYTNVESPEFLGVGVVMDGSGTIVSGASVGDAESALVELADKSRVRAYVSSKDAEAGFTKFATATTTVDAKPIAWKPASVASSDPVLGTTVIALAGKTVTRIASGIVTAITPVSEKGNAVLIETDVSSDSILAGSPIFDVDGRFLGFSTAVSKAAVPSSFISSGILVAKSEEKPAP